MSCIGCSVGTNTDGTPKGCKSNGGCSTGGCNKLNTYDWLSKLDLPDFGEYGYVEVSFKNGARKSFFQHTPHSTYAVTGDMVVVDNGGGSDIGKISLSGDLVRLQMKKKRVKEDTILHKIIRRANQRDLEKLQEARQKEPETLVKARVIARKLKLDMKIGDVEFQGDKRKVTFFYTADGRVDFRELIRLYAKEFRVKIEMRQIGARQESARIGGIGSCGRELCCSTWLSDFRSVSTAAARYQNLAINQTKLSGQCGRLKCCLNYELDTYMDALSAFPKGVDSLLTEAGKAVLVKTDIFKQVMYFAYLSDKGGRGKFYAIPLERVKEVKEMNRNGEKPAELLSDAGKYGLLTDDMPASVEFGDDEGLTGVIELPPEERKRRKKNRNKKRRPQQGRSNREGNRQNRSKASNTSKSSRGNSNKPKPKSGKDNEGGNKPKSSNRNKNRKNKPRNNKPDNRSNNKSNNNTSNNKDNDGKKP